MNNKVIAIVFLGISFCLAVIFLREPTASPQADVIPATSNSDPFHKVHESGHGFSKPGLRAASTPEETIEQLLERISQALTNDVDREFALGTLLPELLRRDPTAAGRLIEIYAPGTP